MDSSRKACGSFSAIARKADTGVSKSALTDFTTGTSVAVRASRENSLKSGLIMKKYSPEHMPVTVNYRRAAIPSSHRYRLTGVRGRNAVLPRFPVGAKG